MPVRCGGVVWRDHPYHWCGGAGPPGSPACVNKARRACLSRTPRRLASPRPARLGRDCGCTGSPSPILSFRHTSDSAVPATFLLSLFSSRLVSFCSVVNQFVNCLLDRCIAHCLEDSFLAPCHYLFFDVFWKVNGPRPEASVRNHSPLCL